MNFDSYDKFDQNFQFTDENPSSLHSDIPQDEFDKTTIKDLDKWEKEKFKIKLENKTIPTSSSFFSSYETVSRKNKKTLSFGNMTVEKFPIHW